MMTQSTRTFSSLDVISNRKLALLYLLGLTAAFDSVEHNILLRRLEITFGFLVKPLQSKRSPRQPNPVYPSWRQIACTTVSAIWHTSGLCIGVTAIQPISARSSSNTVSVITAMLMTINSIRPSTYLNVWL